jgi:hypothetical protein
VDTAVLLGIGSLARLILGMLQVVAEGTKFAV